VPLPRREAVSAHCRANFCPKVNCQTAARSRLVKITVESAPGPTVTNRMHGGNLLGVGSDLGQLFPQLDNRLVESPGGSVVLVAPNVIENAISREYLVRV